VRKIAVIGLGQFGFQVATSLAELGAEVLAIDRDSDVCEQIKRVDRINPVNLDATDEKAMRATGIEESDAVIVAMGNPMEASIVVTAILRRMACQRIIARSTSEIHTQVLTAIGANQITNPEQEMGAQMALTVFSPNVQDRRILSTGHILVEIDSKESLWNKTIGELDFRGRFELNVIAIKKRQAYVDELGESRYSVDTNLLPSGTDIIDEGDILVVIGTEARINDFLTL